MILFLLLNLIANAETMWVDQNGNALYKSLAHCEKYSRGVSCYKTDDGFDKDFYQLVDNEFVKNPQLEQNKLVERAAAKDAEVVEKDEIKALKQKIKNQDLTAADIKKILKFLLKNVGE